MLFPKLTKTRRVLNGYAFDSKTLRKLFYDNKVSSHNFLNILQTGRGLGLEKNLSTSAAILLWAECAAIPSKSILDNINVDLVKDYIKTYYYEHCQVTILHNFMKHVTDNSLSVTDYYLPGNLSVVVKYLESHSDWANYITLCLRHWESRIDLPELLVYLSSMGSFSEIISLVSEKDWALTNSNVLAILHWLRDPEGSFLSTEERDVLIRTAITLGSKIIDPDDNYRPVISAFQVLTLIGEPNEAALLFRRTELGSALGSSWSMKYNLVSHQQKMEGFDKEALQSLTGTKC